MVNEGEEAPNFTLLSDDGRKVSLSDYRDGKVVIYFYPKDGTPGCTREAIEFKDLIEKFEKEDITILGISKDTVKSHQNFKRRYELPFTLLSDPDGKVLMLYGVWKKKHLYGKTFMGTERTTFLVDEKGIVKKIYRKVNVKGHAQTCLIDFKKE